MYGLELVYSPPRSLHWHIKSTKKDASVCNVMVERDNGDDSWLMIINDDDTLNYPRLNKILHCGKVEYVSFRV